jgi:hypothetical protein
MKRKEKDRHKEGGGSLGVRGKKEERRNENKRRISNCITDYSKFLH